MIRCAAIAASIGLCAAQAGAFCDDMARIARTGGSLVLPGSDLIAECSTSLQLGGGQQLQCGWPFGYRSAEASAAFGRLNEAVAACLGPDAEASRDQSVNHPDFYDLRLYQIAGRETAVSLKDKAALQQTYVFLRISRGTP